MILPSIHWRQYRSYTLHGALVLHVILVAMILIAGARAEDATPKIKDKPNPELTQTVTVKKTARLKDLVATFVTELIDQNTGGVKDSYETKTAVTEELLGRRMRKNPFEAFQWFVIESTTAEVKGQKDALTAEGEYIYIARQQLLGVLRSSWGSQTNVLAKVRVKTHWTGKGSLPDDDQIRSGTRVTLSFEGFLDSLPASRLEEKDGEN